MLQKIALSATQQLQKVPGALSTTSAIFPLCNRPCPLVNLCQRFELLNFHRNFQPARTHKRLAGLLPEEVQAGNEVVRSEKSIAL